MITREDVLKGVGEIVEQCDLFRVDCVCKEAIVDYIVWLIVQEANLLGATPNPCDLCIPGGDNPPCDVRCEYYHYE